MSCVKVRICVLGLLDAGKSTVINNLINNSLKNNEFLIKILVEYGISDVKMIEIDIFGTQNFNKIDIIRDILNESNSGIMLVINSNNNETFSYLEKFFHIVTKDITVPTIALANKQDINGSFIPHDISEIMELSTNIPIIGTIANNGSGIEISFTTLLEMIKNNDIINNDNSLRFI